MKQIKLFTSLLAAVAVMAIALPSQAQVTGYATPSTNYVAPTATNTVQANFAPAFVRSRWVTFQPSFRLVVNTNGTALTNTVAATAVFTVDASADGSIWTNAYATITVVAGTNDIQLATNLYTKVFTTITNIDTGGAAFWRWGTVGNSSTNGMTNLVFNTGQKTGL